MFAFYPSLPLRCEGDGGDSALLAPSRDEAVYTAYAPASQPQSQPQQGLVQVAVQEEEAGAVVVARVDVLLGVPAGLGPLGDYLQVVVYTPGAGAAVVDVPVTVRRAHAGLRMKWRVDWAAPSFSSPPPVTGLPPAV